MKPRSKRLDDAGTDDQRRLCRELRERFRDLSPLFGARGGLATVQPRIVALSPIELLGRIDRDA